MLGKDNGVAVRLRIYSLAVHGGEQQEQQQDLAAQFFQKGKADYIRYVEELEGVGSVSTTVKVEERQVSILRHGAIKMKHSYRLEEKTTSMYQTGQGALSMEAETTRLEYIPFPLASQACSSVHSEANTSNQAQLTLSYRLSLQGQFVGHFTLQLSLLANESKE